MSDQDTTDRTITGTLDPGESSQDLPHGLIVTLEVIEGPDKGARFEVKKTRTFMGRKGDVKLSDPTVSGTHAVLEYAAGRLFLTDQGSTNGTFINSDTIESGPVDNMDEIKLGDTKMLLSVVEDKYGTWMPEDTGSEVAHGVSHKDDDTMAMADLPNPDLPSSLNVVLEVQDGPDKGRKFKITKRATVIGRGDDAQVMVKDSSVSKKHCQIEIHNKDKMTVKDLASRNGTRLNGRYISAVKVRHGDVIQMGSTKIKLLIHIKK